MPDSSLVNKDRMIAMDKCVEMCMRSGFINVRCKPLPTFESWVVYAEYTGKSVDVDCVGADSISEEIIDGFRTMVVRFDGVCKPIPPYPDDSYYKEV